MASSLEFVQYAAEQLQDAGDIAYRKMFGEYGLYCDGKFFALICGNQFFVKITQAGRKQLPQLTEAPPYDGAKPYFLMESLDNQEQLIPFVKETCKELPFPVPKKKKGKK